MINIRILAPEHTLTFHIIVIKEHLKKMIDLRGKYADHALLQTTKFVAIHGTEEGYQPDYYKHNM